MAANMLSSSIIVNPTDSSRIDVIYHFGISSANTDLPGTFGDVKFVCTGGSASRLHNYAKLFSASTKLSLSENLSRTDRYAMWKTGPVLWINHGMGVPSLSIMLLETFKLVHLAGARNVEFIRMGTSGGIGVEPGTVILSTGAVNGLLEQKYIQYISGQVVKRDAILSSSLTEELHATALKLGMPIEKGLTFCADDFYEGQMRLDGFFCEYTTKEKLEFLHRLDHLGVKNIEMESTGFAALTHRANFPGAIICVALLNRLEKDTSQLEKSVYQQFEMRPFEIVSAYINARLLQNGF